MPLHVCAQVCIYLQSKSPSLCSLSVSHLSALMECAPCPEVKPFTPVRCQQSGGNPTMENSTRFTRLSGPQMIVYAAVTSGLGAFTQHSFASTAGRSVCCVHCRSAMQLAEFIYTCSRVRHAFCLFVQGNKWLVHLLLAFLSQPRLERLC